MCRLARLEYLISRRPELLNSVMLRQNPHNVAEWHKRVKLFEGNPTKQILTYTEVGITGAATSRSLPHTHADVNETGRRQDPHLHRGGA